MHSNCVHFVQNKKGNFKPTTTHLVENVFVTNFINEGKMSLLYFFYYYTIKSVFELVLVSFKRSEIKKVKKTHRRLRR